MSGIKEKMVAGVEKLSAKLPGHHSNTGTTHTTSTRGTEFGTGATTGTGTGYSTDMGTGSLSDTRTGQLTGGSTVPETQYESTTGYATGAPTTGTATGTLTETDIGYTGTGSKGVGADYTESGSKGVGAGYTESGSKGVGAGYTGAGATTTTTGVGSGYTGTATGGAISQSEIIDSKTFTKTTDEEVLIEKKRYELEHRPVQEQYVVETRKIGEKRIPGAATEVVGTDVREVEHRAVPHARGEREVIVEDVDIDVPITATETREYTTGTGTRSTATGKTY